MRGQLGLDRCKLALSAAAPIMKETLEFMMSLDIPVYETYGMSESTGPHTVSTSKRFKVTSVGTEIPGGQTRLHSPDQDGNGEVILLYSLVLICEGHSVNKRNLFEKSKIYFSEFFSYM